MKPKTHTEFHLAFQAFSIQVRDGNTFETEEKVTDRMRELEASAKQLQIPFILDHDRYLNIWRSVEDDEDEDDSSSEEPCSEEESSSYQYDEDQQDDEDDEDDDN